MSTTTTLEPKKESLGISAALILSLVGLTLLLVIAVLIKREIRRGNVKSKRDGHFWSCKFFRKYTQSKTPKDGKQRLKVKPQWLLVAHHELPEHYYTKNECPQYVARMFTIDLYTVFQYTCQETFPDRDNNLSIESYLVSHYPTLNEPMQTFRRLKVRAEVDLVPFTLTETEISIKMFNQLLERLSDFVNNPYLIQRQIDPASFTNIQEHEDHPVKMSSKYIPILPKDLCQIPLRPIDDDSLANLNKRSRNKGRFPFHLPSFLNKRKFFSMKSSSSSQNAKTRTDGSLSQNPEVSIEEQDTTYPLNDETTNKQTRQRLKRQPATDAVPLVEFHDAHSQSNTSNSEMGPNA